MSVSTTIIAALKFLGGVVIAADSQASDPIAQVRWQVEKLEKMGKYPLVLGFSGSVGRSQAARSRLEGVKLHPGQLNNRVTVQKEIEKALQPIYQSIKQTWLPSQHSLWDVTLWGLAAMRIGVVVEILELEANGDSSFHNYFHAIGSASQTAYAIYRTLGGKQLVTLPERKAVWTTLRILRTCAAVEMWGVSEPTSVWVLTNKDVRNLSEDELQAELQAVDAWEEQERKLFLGS